MKCAVCRTLAGCWFLWVELLLWDFVAPGFVLCYSLHIVCSNVRCCYMWARYWGSFYRGAHVLLYFFLLLWIIDFQTDDGLKYVIHTYIHTYLYRCIVIISGHSLLASPAQRPLNKHSSKSGDSNGQNRGVKMNNNISKMRRRFRRWHYFTALTINLKTD